MRESDQHERRADCLVCAYFILNKIFLPIIILAVLQKNIPSEFFKEHISESSAQTFGPREVILSEYLVC